MRCHGEKLHQLFAGIVRTVGTIYDIFTLGTLPNLADTAIADVSFPLRKAAITIDVFWLYGRFVSFRPGFSYFFSGGIIIFLGCLVSRTFSADNPTVGDYFIRVSSFQLVPDRSMETAPDFRPAPSYEIEYHNQNDNPNRAEDCQPDSHVS